MATFSDDFNRPDGPIGNGWSYTPGTPQIVSGVVQVSTSAGVWRSPFGAGTYLRAKIDANSSTGSTYHPNPAVCIGDNARQMYHCHFTSTVSGNTFTILKRVGGVDSQLAVTTWGPRETGWKTLEITYNDGVITATCDGAHAITANDNALGGNRAVGFRLGVVYSRADNFDSADSAITALDAEPEPIVAMAQQQQLTLTGTGTSWTPGTPGSPTFEVDKGTLANQSVLSPTEATADYTPPQADDVARFTDPSTGNFDDVALSTGFQVEAGQPCPWTAEQVGTNEEGESVFGDLQALKSVGPTFEWGVPHDSFLQQVMDIDVELPWKTLNFPLTFHYESVRDSRVIDPVLLSVIQAMLGNDLAVDQDTNTLVRKWTANDTMTVFDLIASLKGLGAYDNTQVANLIRGISNNEQYSLLSVMQWISALRGENNVDLTMLYSLVSTIAPPDLSPITDYLDWITSSKSVSLPPIKTAADTAVTRINAVFDALAADYNNLTNVGARNLQQLWDKLNDLDSDLGTDTLSLTNLIIAVRDLLAAEYANIHAHLHTLTDKVDALQSDVTYIKNNLHSEQPGAPVWPGLANVTIGQQKPLAVGVTLAGPLHGVIIDVTSAGTHGPPFQFDGDLSHQKIGAITFQTDNGKNEFPQLLGFGHAIYTPKAMKQANAAKIRCAADVIGTATAWRLTS